MIWIIRNRNYNSEWEVRKRNELRVVKLHIYLIIPQRASTLAHGIFEVLSPIPCLCHLWISQICYHQSSVEVHKFLYSTNITPNKNILTTKNDIQTRPHYQLESLNTYRKKSNEMDGWVKWDHRRFSSFLHRPLFQGNVTHYNICFTSNDFS